jgi:hypothetical protein
VSPGSEAFPVFNVTLGALNATLNAFNETFDVFKEPLNALNEPLKALSVVDQRARGATRLADLRRAATPWDRDALARMA